MFDSGVTHSFIAREFMSALWFVSERLSVSLGISTLIGYSIMF